MITAYRQNHLDMPFLHRTFHSYGYNKKWLVRLKVIGVIVAAAIVLLFVATAVNAHIEANYVTASAQWTSAICNL